jgi:hypothetical protein
MELDMIALQVSREIYGTCDLLSEDTRVEKLSRDPDSRIGITLTRGSEVMLTVVHEKEFHVMKPVVSGILIYSTYSVRPRLKPSKL